MSAHAAKMTDQQAKPGDRVKVHYTGTLPDGTVFDSSKNREPLEFTLGQGQIIRGFEEAVVGMAPGDTKKETIPPDRAYGAPRDDLRVKVPRESLPEGLAPNVGETLYVRQPDGNAAPVRVADVGEQEVTLDANHPLAGQQLVFEIELVEIG